MSNLASLPVMDIRPINPDSEKRFKALYTEVLDIVGISFSSFSYIDSAVGWVLFALRYSSILTLMSVGFIFLDSRQFLADIIFVFITTHNIETFELFVNRE